MRIVYFAHPDNPRTGGHKYNDKFIAYFTQKLHCQTVFLPELPLLYPGWKKIYAPIAELKMLRFIKSDDIVFWGDTTYKYHFILLILCKLFIHCKNITIVHHFPYLEYSGFKRIIYEWIQKMYYSMADYIIVPSPYTLNVALENYDKEKVIYIPLPFEVTYSKSDNYQKGQILYIGTIEPRKGTHLLLQSLAILKKSNIDFHLSIVGKNIDSKYENQLSLFIKDNNLTDNITFLGHCSNEQLHKEYSSAEIFVLPSLLEGYGIVLIEAMSHGLPIVAFNNTAMPYTIKSGKNGLLAKNKDAYDMAVKIKEILGNEKLRYELQQGIEEHISTLKTEADFHMAIDNFLTNIIK